MLSVALTGNVASGKSTVADLWERAGVPVARADDLARKAVEPGSEGLAHVVRAFSERMLGPDGALDRDRMRALVFSDEAARARLEAIVHPRVRALGAEWIRAREREDAPLAVTEIPLLYETGREGDFDLTVLVDAPAETRLQRLVRTRALAEDEARRMIAAQWDPARKRAQADIVIDNAGSLFELERRASAVLAELRVRAAGGSAVGGSATGQDGGDSAAGQDGGDSAAGQDGGDSAAGRAPPPDGGGARLRMDLHLHTAASYDCLSDPERVLARARRLGYGRIAITDHNTLSAALRMARAHPEHVIPGEEVRTAEGVDVIGLYLSEEIPKGTPARDTVRRIHDQGGIAYLPHPYAEGKGGGGRLADELAPLCDIIEVFNARLHDPTMNERAQGLASRHAKPCGAGSDAHTLAELGNAFVEVEPHANAPDALLAALRDARSGGREASRLVHLASTWAKVRGRLPGAR